MTASANRKGRVAIVTGAASGIGLATVRALKGGAQVVGVDLSVAPAELAGHSDLDWVRGDVAGKQTWQQVQAAVNRRDIGGPQCVVACAGEVVVAPFLETAPEEWQRLFDVNVIGVLRVLQTFLPQMIARGSGAVAVVCSVNSLYVEDQLSAYSTSKAALLHVVRSAALEFAHHGVRINAVCPGAVDTPMLQRHFNSLPDPAAARRAVEQRTPTGKLIRPEEVAAVLRFLVSDEASGLSGAALVVDGGLTSAYDFSRAP